MRTIGLKFCCGTGGSYEGALISEDKSMRDTDAESFMVFFFSRFLRSFSS